MTVLLRETTKRTFYLSAKKIPLVLFVIFFIQLVICCFFAARIVCNQCLFVSPVMSPCVHAYVLSCLTCYVMFHEIEGNKRKENNHML